MSFTPAQRQQAISLYKRLLQTSHQTFQGDAATATAWRQQVREKFRAASKETESAKIDEGLHMWEEVIKVLRHNVVQGQYKEDRQAFHLNFTKDTELGSNESVKQGRKLQMEQLKANKGVPKCGGASASASTSSSGPSTVRGYSTSAILRASKTIASHRLPRPAPHFPQTVLLSDGSSIQLTTTSPRSSVRLTRDPTNHPLWNPSMNKKGGMSDEDESGRLGRFRRRFGGAEDGEAQSADGASKATSGKKTDGGFNADDLEWMNGGTEAKAGAPVNARKGDKKK
jgi:ribosomal protein L31